MYYKIVDYNFKFYFILVDKSFIDDQGIKDTDKNTKNTAE